MTTDEVPSVSNHLAAPQQQAVVNLSVDVEEIEGDETNVLQMIISSNKRSINEQSYDEPRNKRPRNDQLENNQGDQKESSPYEKGVPDETASEQDNDDLKN